MLRSRAKPETLAFFGGCWSCKAQAHSVKLTRLLLHLRSLHIPLVSFLNMNSVLKQSCQRGNGYSWDPPRFCYKSGASNFQKLMSKSSWLFNSNPIRITSSSPPLYSPVLETLWLVSAFRLFELRGNRCVMPSNTCSSPWSSRNYYRGPSW